MLVVMKFGGTSLADVDRIRHCASMVGAQASESRVVTVVSAMGGVTDKLLELADAAAAGNRSVQDGLLAVIRERHEAAAVALNAEVDVHPLLDQLERLVSGVAAVGELTARSRDAVVSFGERLSARLMGAALDGPALTGAEAGIVTDEQFGEAEPLMDLSLYQIREALEKGVSNGDMVTVTGFVAATQHGVTSTIGRGGSDYTATILGAALRADEIWICSDVDGLMTADPRIVPDAQLLESITFAEAIEMGQFGAKSMHPRALEPAAEHRLPVRIRNTFNADCEGTLICEDAPSPHVTRAVLLLRGTALLTVEGAAMVGRPGTAARVFEGLAAANVNVQMISQTVSESGISLVVGRQQVARARSALERELLRTGVARHVRIEEDAQVVAVVGAGMRGTRGVAARVFGAVAESGVNVLAIAQGSSELSISFVVDGNSGDEAVRAIHAAFDLGDGKSG